MQSNRACGSGLACVPPPAFSPLPKGNFDQPEIFHGHKPPSISFSHVLFSAPSRATPLARWQIAEQHFPPERVGLDCVLGGCAVSVSLNALHSVRWAKTKQEFCGLRSLSPGRQWGLPFLFNAIPSINLPVAHLQRVQERYLSTSASLLAPLTSTSNTCTMGKRTRWILP